MAACRSHVYERQSGAMCDGRRKNGPAPVTAWLLGCGAARLIGQTKLSRSGGGEQPRAGWRGTHADGADDDAFLTGCRVPLHPGLGLGYHQQAALRFSDAHRRLSGCRARPEVKGPIGAKSGLQQPPPPVQQSVVDGSAREITREYPGAWQWIILGIAPGLTEPPLRCSGRCLGAICN